MKIYTVCTYVMEIEVKEDEWENIDFNEADRIAGEELHWCLENNKPTGAGFFRHYKNEEDAIEHVESE